MIPRQSGLTPTAGPLNSTAGQTVPLLNAVNRTWPLAPRRDAIPPLFPLWK